MEAHVAYLPKCLYLADHKEKKVEVKKNPLVLLVK